MSSPSTKTIKKLFALSGNNCAFPKCTAALIDENSGSIIGEICHIKARNPEGARYDANQADEQRHAFENLVLMCPIHHIVIDDDEESYSVERLQQIKQNHELQSSASTKTDLEQKHFEMLLESKLRQIIEREDFQADNPKKQIDSVNSSLLQAKNLAKIKQHKDFQRQWLSSHKSLVDVIDSVNQIFSLIEQRFVDEAETFKILEVSLYKEKYLRVISNLRFGCQIELKGVDDVHSFNVTTNIQLQITLFKKTSLPQNSNYFTGETLSKQQLKPGINVDHQVVWTNESSEQNSPEQVYEKCFQLFIDQINKKLPLDETIAGGRYTLNGVLVNAWGEPIDDNEF